MQQKLNPGNRKYNPKYGLSLENLQDFRINVLRILGDSAADYIALIDKCALANPDLKLYSRQRHIINNPNYFSIVDFTDSAQSQYLFLDIDTTDQKKLNEFIKKIYWFGFLCGDGTVDFKKKDISFSLQQGDKDYVQAFADAVGYEGEIKLKKKYMEKYDKTYYRYIVEFGCEAMVEDLKQLGWFGGRSEEKHLPPIVKELITHAKQIANKGGIDWKDTNAGKLALAWLLGFYDAEGYLGKNKEKTKFVMARTTITQGYENKKGRYVGKELLEEIKLAYGVCGEVKSDKKNGKITPDSRIFFNNDDLEFFEKMLSVYQYSLYRKRLDQFEET